MSLGMLHTCSGALSAWGSILDTNIFAALPTCHEGVLPVTGVVVYDWPFIYDWDQEQLRKDKGNY